MSARTRDSIPSRTAHVRTTNNSRSVLTRTGLAMTAVFVGGVAVVLGQWILGSCAIALLLAGMKRFHRPASQEEVLAEEQWLQAVVDTWAIGRSV